MSDDLSSDDPVGAIRALAQSVIDYGESQPDIAAEHAADSSMSTDLWYERYCLLVVQVVERLARTCGFECEVICGLFVGRKQEGRYPTPLRHAWLETPDGTIIDPTSAQMGLNECAIIEPDHEIYRHYRMRGWWKEGEGELAPWAERSEPPQAESAS